MNFCPEDSLCRFLRDEEAATAVEYAIMIVLIALVVIVSVGVLGQKTEQSFNKFATSFNH